MLVKGAHLLETLFLVIYFDLCLFTKRRLVSRVSEINPDTCISTIKTPTEEKKSLFLSQIESLVEKEKIVMFFFVSIEKTELINLLHVIHTAELGILGNFSRPQN